MKNLKTLTIIIMLSLYSTKGDSQNLLQNPSFEDTIPNNGICKELIDFSTHWFNPNAATADLYTYNPHSANCTISSLNNPSGYQLPRTGNAYAGLYTYAGSTREYAATKLIEPLSAGCNYYIEFYYSRADGFGMASDNLGCAFTDDTSGFYTTPNYLPLIPAIESQSGVLLTDSQNWNPISGIYQANGTEQFFLIGNFHPDSDTYFDTVSTSLYNSAYYYIDDVTILSCDSTATMSIENKIINGELFVYPNPTSDMITINNQGSNKIEFADIVEQSGRLLMRQRLRSGDKQFSFSVEELKSGSYLLIIYFESGGRNYSELLVIK